MGAYRELEVTLLSARDLKSVNLITRMDVYAVATISGDPLTRQCTPPDPHGGSHPTWNATLRFAVPPTAAAAAGRCLHVLLRAERVLGDRDVGEVIVPLPDLLLAAGADDAAPAAPPRLASYYVYKVHRPGEPRGVLSLSYRLGPVVAPLEKPPSGVVHGYPVTAGERAEKPAPRLPPARSGSEISIRAQPQLPPTQIFLDMDAHTQINLDSPRTTSGPKAAGFSQQDDRQGRAYAPAANNKPNTNPVPDKTDHRLVSKPVPQQQNTRAYGHTQSTNNNKDSGKIDASGHKVSFPQQDTTRANNNLGKTESFVHKAFPRHDTQAGAPHSRSNVSQRMPDRQQAPKDQFIQQDKHVGAYAY